MQSNRICSVRDCQRDSITRGYCEKHYRELLRTGSRKRHRAYEPTEVCSVEGCESRPVSRGMCNPHYCAAKRHGNPLKTVYGPRGQGTISKKYGYRLVACNGRQKAEHRVVMEEALGRQLTSGEIIHHRDGNKTNNALSNLEITNRRDHARMHHPIGTTCLHGHDRTPANTYWMPSGAPSCRICRKEASHRSVAKRRGK